MGVNSNPGFLSFFHIVDGREGSCFAGLWADMLVLVLVALPIAGFCALLDPFANERDLFR